jgi:hypothetical protein
MKSYRLIAEIQEQFNSAFAHFNSEADGLSKVKMYKR